MRRGIQAIAVLVAVAAAASSLLLAGSAGAGLDAESQSGSDPCPRTRDLDPGRSDGPFYSTVAPFEHFGSNRAQVFPRSCNTRQLTGTDQPVIAERSSPEDFATPYISATRNRNQLYVYGYGSDAAEDGAFVASVDPRTLAERWRTSILDRRPDHGWSYPGVMAVHGNGYLYAVYGNVIAKLDPRTGETLQRARLPEDPEGTGAAYNGLVVLPDGRIATKKIERGPCAITPGVPASAGAISGLFCSVANGLPSEIVIVDPRKLEILSSIVPPEPITGRITAGRSDGRDYIYGAGRDSLVRFRYRDGDLSLDRKWGPVTYRTGDQTPGTGPGILGGFVVVQTNFATSTEPMTLTAVSVHDSERVFRIRPFENSGTGSWIVSKAALDERTGMVVTHDTVAGRMAGIHLDPRRGFEVSWRRDIKSLSFSALVGPPAKRQIVIPDSSSGGDEVVWLDERTGSEVTRSEPLAVGPAPGNIVTPGFGGRFYYTSAAGKLWELRPLAP